MKKGFAFEVTSDMIHEMHLTGSSLLVFAYLDAFSKDGGYYVHGIENIGKMLGLSRYTVYNAVRSLQINNLIEVSNFLGSQGKTYKRIRTITERR